MYTEPFAEGENQFCHNCGREVAVDIKQLYTETTNFDAYGENVLVFTTHVLVKCKNCGELTYLTYHQDNYEPDIEYNNETGEEEPYLAARKVSHFPFVAYPELIRDKEKEAFPKQVLKLLKESYAAHQCNCRILATVALRMVVDAVCQDEEAKKNIKKARRDQLVEAGFIDSETKNEVEQVYDGANLAAHTFIELSDTEYISAYELIIHFLKEVYIFPQLRASVPLVVSHRTETPQPAQQLSSQPDQTSCEPTSTAPEAQKDSFDIPATTSTAD